MNFLDNWGELLTPKHGFAVQDVWQIVVIAALLLLSSRLFRSKKKSSLIERYNPLIWLKKNRSFLVFWTVVAILYLVCEQLFGIKTPVFRFFTLLGSAWIVIGLLASLLREKFWTESAAAVAYLLSGLFGLALVEDSIRLLEDLRINLGSFSISAWGILAGIIAFVLTLWVSLAIARIIEKQIEAVPRLSPSLKVLIGKIVRIVLIIIATVIAFSSVGVDLSALTVLGGAIGLGLGFGLQKVVSNLVSGIILLLDNSIKPGDVIEIDGTYGWINHLRARYASVITRDGTEHLIPNEDLITQRVINWSFTDNLVRLRIPFGVSYNADPHQCIKLALAAALSVDRVLKSRDCSCLVCGFGDSSINLELRVWIGDPSNGVTNVQSDILLKLWDTFKANNIEIPFPQRDIHIRSSDVRHVQHDNPDTTPAT